MSAQLLPLIAEPARVDKSAMPHSNWPRQLVNVGSG
jgi:hypothetical protein